MPTVRRPRAETQAETRRCLLDAAQQLFERSGFHRTTVAQIAREAGYTTGAIYANFPRKEDLALAVLERDGLADWARLDVELERSTDFADRLVEVVRWYRNLLVTGQPIGIVRVELLLHSLQDAELRAALVEAQRRQQIHVGQLIHQIATEAGSTVLVEPEMLAAAVLGSADGTAIANSLDPSRHQAAAFAWTLATLLLDALDPPPVDEAGRADLFARLLAVAETG